MKITLTDGREIEMPFAAGAVGYVATKIEVTADDITAMREMADRRPDDFQVHMRQLEARFPERRAGYRPHQHEFVERNPIGLKIGLSSGYGKTKIGEFKP